MKDVAFDIFNPIGTITSNGCLQLYCHSQGTGWTSNLGDTRTTASDLKWRTIVWTTVSNCGTCHGTDATGRPLYTTYSPKANSHLAHSAYSCDACHFATTSNGATVTSIGRHLNKLYDMQWKTSVGNYGTFSYSYAAGGGTCSGIQCHNGTNAVWGSSGSANMSCVACHSSAKGPRRAVMGEFGAGNNGWATLGYWGHKRAQWGSATVYDCGVCHMEGDAQTGSSNPTYHKNSKLDFRDPDTGTGILDVVWVSIGNTPGNGWYSITSAISSIGVFSRNTGSATLEKGTTAIMINLCLKCHDANGAMSTLARVGGAAANGMRPFNNIATVANVYNQFWYSNASYHPILARQNDSYAWGTTMVAPWRSITKTSGANGQYGYLMTCWDCHNDDPVIGWQSSRSVTAHGNVRTLRKPYDKVDTAATQLCVVCHNTSVYWGAYTHPLNQPLTSWNTTSTSPTGSHPVGNGEYWGCVVCHGSARTYNSPMTSMARAERAGNVHGFNGFWGTTRTTWQSGTRPYSFLRNTVTFNNNWNWRTTGGPLRMTCGMNCGGSRGPYNYGPGGTY